MNLWLMAVKQMMSSAEFNGWQWKEFSGEGKSSATVERQIATEGDKAIALVFLGAETSIYSLMTFEPLII